MGFLFSKKKISAPPQLTGLEIQTAVNVLSIPLVYGCPRITMNVIYVNGFRAVAQKAQGGKGLLSGGKGQTTGYKYYSTFAGALCEGEVGDLLLVWDNQQTYGMNNAPDGKVFQMFNGSPTQNPWPYITLHWPGDDFAYRNTAYIGFEDWPLDSSATIPQLNFLIEGKYSGTCPLNVFVAPDTTEYLFDADPALVILDFMTNDTYGAGFPIAYIDQDTLFTSADGLNPLVGDMAVSTYCQAVGFGWSLVLSGTEPAASVLDRLLKNILVAPVWTGAILKFIPYWDTTSSSNPGYYAPLAGVGLKYYTPSIPVRFNLTDDDFIQTSRDDDPVIVTRADISDIKNVVRLDYRDRNNLFNDNVSESKDENLAELYGQRVERMGTADEFTLGTYAATAAQIKLQRNVSVRNTYSFRLGWQYCILDPMDVVTITDSNLGLDEWVVRIVSIEEDEKGILFILAEDFRIGAGTAEAFDRQENIPPTDLQTNIAPPDVNEPIIFEPTTLSLQAAGKPILPMIVLGASGGPPTIYDPNWGGCDVWVSNDDVTYQFMGTLNQPSRQGELTGTLVAYSGSNPDTTSTLAVDMSQSNATLESVTTAQALSGINLFAVVDTVGDFELLSAETVTLTGPNEYDLTNLYRGLYGTIACEHLTGSKLVRVDELVFEAALPPAFIGVPLWVKLASFNIWGLETQQLSDCTAYTYTPVGSGTDLLINPVISALLVGQAVDLESAGGPAVDLNLGGSGACAPTSISIDLENL